MNIDSTIHAYEQFGEWTHSLHTVSDQDWHRPIGEGKASIAEIIAHLRNWDLHLINEVIPSVRQGEGMRFPDFDTYNAIAYEHARSGISQEQLLQEFVSDRMRLIQILKSMRSEDLTLEVTANGVPNCPHTGTPYSLLYIIHEFVEHDEHHKSQILKVMK